MNMWLAAEFIYNVYDVCNEPIETKNNRICACNGVLMRTFKLIYKVPLLIVQYSNSACDNHNMTEQHAGYTLKTLMHNFLN